MEETVKNKGVVYTSITLVLLLLVSMGTYAWYTWRSNNTTVTFTVESNFKCAVDGGGTITSNGTNLAPTSNCSGSHTIVREVKVMPTVNRGNVYMNLWMNIDSMDTPLLTSANFRYALTKSATSCANPVASGVFKDNSNNKLTLLDSQTYNATITDTYYLHIWLDEKETSSATMNKSFKLSLGGECSDQVDITKFIKVDVPTGLIPVTIADNGAVTTASASSNTWYDYGNKVWANAISVTESSRSKYLNTNGVSVTQSDILAYFVYVPRYEYQIWTNRASDKGKEQEINIKFQNNTQTKSNDLRVGGWYTHPAFTFGDDELNGIWVGKFETSTDTSSTCYTSNSEEDCDNTNQNPRILPNVYSLTRQAISNQFQISLKFGAGSMSSDVVTFASTNPTYGIIADSHMMKNSEWGAVAYLSLSKYGINGEIRINNNSNPTTGCGASSANGSSTSSCQIAYGNGGSNYPQSTTGNISGVFDMSGGVSEHVMGNYNNTTSSSGLSTSWFTKNTKYYDKYDVTWTSSCTLAACGGHALFEVNGWYSDDHDFVNSDNSWFVRGGSSYYGANAGAAGFSYAYGDAGNIGSRAVVAVQTTR